MATLDDIWGALEDGGYFTYAELRLVTDISGCTKETLDDMVFSRFGERDAADFVGL